MENIEPDPGLHVGVTLWIVEMELVCDPCLATMLVRSS